MTSWLGVVGEESVGGLEDLHVNHCQWEGKRELVIEGVGVLEGEGFEEILSPVLLLSVEVWVGGGGRGKNHGSKIHLQALLHHLLLQLLLSFHLFHQVGYFF